MNLCMTFNCRPIVLARQPTQAELLLRLSASPEQTPHFHLHVP